MESKTPNHQVTESPKVDVINLHGYEQYLTLLRNVGRASLPIMKNISQIRSLALSSDVAILCTTAKHINPNIKIPSIFPISLSLATGIYIATDLIIKVNQVKSEQRQRVLADQLIWHGSASLLIPGATIYSTMKLSDLVIKQVTTAKLPIQLIPPILGITAIFVGLPYGDQLTDWWMGRAIKDRHQWLTNTFNDSISSSSQRHH